MPTNSWVCQTSSRRCDGAWTQTRKEGQIWLSSSSELPDRYPGEISFRLRHPLVKPVDQEAKSVKCLKAGLSHIKDLLKSFSTRRLRRWMCKRTFTHRPSPLHEAWILFPFQRLQKHTTQLKSNKQSNIENFVHLKPGFQRCDSFASKESCTCLGLGETDQEFLVFRAWPHDWGFDTLLSGGGELAFQWNVKPSAGVSQRFASLWWCRCLISLCN